jgi:hypothetical protein
MVHFGNSVAYGTLPLIWGTSYSEKKREKGIFLLTVLLFWELHYIILPSQTDHSQISGQ